MAKWRQKKVTQFRCIQKSALILGTTISPPSLRRTLSSSSSTVEGCSLAMDLLPPGSSICMVFTVTAFLYQCLLLTSSNQCLITSHSSSDAPTPDVILASLSAADGIPLHALASCNEGTVPALPKGTPHSAWEQSPHPQEQS